MSLFEGSLAAGIAACLVALLVAPPLFPRRAVGAVLSVFSHRSNGGAYTAALLRAMCFGIASLVAFFVAVALLLPPLGLAAGVLRRAGA